MRFCFFCLLPALLSLTQPPRARCARAPGWDVLADDAYARGGSSARLRAWDKPGQGGGGGARVEGDGDEEEEEEDV